MNPELHSVAKRAQIPRNGVINLLDNPHIETILQGAFVRVLLEMQDHREDYIVARVDGVEHGEAYSGFSQNATQSTTIVLRLQLPTCFTSYNGNLYQLTSISNSPMSVEELSRWLSTTESDGVQHPTLDELNVIAERIKPYVQRRPNAAGSAQQQAGALQMQPSVVAPRQANGAASPVGAAPPQPPAAAGLDVTARYQPPAHAVFTDDDLPNRQQIHMQILNELRDKWAVFPKDITGLKSTHLRLAERDLIDYLDNVRTAINSKRSVCVICMDQVASVIMLPCKHKVLCRLCAPSVSSCPCCRHIAVELFEPCEI